MTQRLVTSSHQAFAATTTPLEQLCDAITANDMTAFDRLLPQIDDLDGHNHCALIACTANNRFAMAKKIFLRGAARTLVLGLLEAFNAEAYQKYMNKPSGQDDEELKDYQSAKAMYDRFAGWNASFQNDTLPLLPAQKIQELEDKIDALRQELAEALSPTRTIVKKAAPAPNSGGTPAC